MKKLQRMPLNIQLFAEGEPVTQTDDKIEGTGTEPVTKTEVATVKTFTQEEVNALEMKWKKKMPSKEDLEAFNQWKESQKTEVEKNKEILDENSRLKTQISIYENLDKVENAGVDKKFAKFVLSEISGKDGEIEDLIKDYVKNNPQFLMSKEDSKKSTGFSQNNTSQAKSEEQAYLDKKYAKNPYYKQK